MNAAKLRALLDRIRNPRILVVGDLILDRYVTGEVRRISPEAPIPVLTAISDDERLGGAGNVAANLRAMQAYVEVVGVTGDDGRGRQMKELFDALGVDSSGCSIDPTRPTIMKTRLISGVQQMMRVDWESPAPISDQLAETVVADVARRVQHAHALILSDYGKGFLTKRVLEGAIGAARARNIPILVDPKGGDYGRYRGATLVTPNRREAEEAVGWSIDKLDRLPQAAFEIIERAGLGACVITLGAEGMFYRSVDGTDGRVPTQARAVFDVTGAGDTVISHIALGLASGLPLGDSVALANHAAGIVVGKRGACSVTRIELATALAEGHNQGKVLAETDLDQAVATWRKEGRRIVFTNGCFDVIHPGHVDYLRFAASKGDILIVGINDDASVSRAKGPGRPICVLKDRMEVLAALEMVDAVVPFSKDTPLELIQRITPDVLVKGEDWRDKGVVGREWVESHGGLVHLAPLVAGRSTTGIVERIRGTDPAATGRRD